MTTAPSKDDLRIRLLIVDDEQSIRKLCVTVGEALGFICFEADSGAGFQPLTTASAGPDGSFTASVTPRTTTTYRAVVAGEPSPPVTLLVLDRSVTVTSTRAAGGRSPKSLFAGFLLGGGPGHLPRGRPAPVVLDLLLVPADLAFQLVQHQVGRRQDVGVAGAGDEFVLVLRRHHELHDLVFLLQIDRHLDHGQPGEKMEEMLGAIVFQLGKGEERHGMAGAGVLVNGQRAPGTVDVERMRREYGKVFATGTTRDQVILEAKDISDVEAVVDMVVYSDATADVQNERAFKQLMAMRKGQLLAMEKVNEVVKHVLADPTVDSPISAALTELTPLADVPQRKNRSPEDTEFSEAIHLQSTVKNFQNMQRWRMNMPEREYLAQYLEGQEKRVALMSPHCEIEKTTAK